MTKFIDIIDFRITYFDNSLIVDQAKNVSVSRIKHKLKELSKCFAFVLVDTNINVVVA